MTLDLVVALVLLLAPAQEPGVQPQIVLVDCGSRETKATHPLPSGRTGGIELLPAPSSQGYDGLYATPTLTVAPPAR